MKYQYDPGDGRYKHKWKYPYAGFEQSGSGYVGKCDSTITTEIAESELNHGIPYDFENRDHPSKIYVLYNGVIYEAVPTEYGTSYHAYPWRGDLPGRTIPRRVLRKLERVATEKGMLREMRAWLKKYGQ